jgi:hypothetical protein
LLNDHLAVGAELPDVRAAYRELQAAYARRYRILRRLQRLLRGWYDPPLGNVLGAFAGGLMHRYLARVYWDVAAPIEPAASFRPARGVLVGLPA